MVKKIGKITLHIVAGANVATILAMLLVGMSDRVCPTGHPIVATLGLTFPIFIALNVAFTAFWVAVKPKWVIIPVAGFLLCYSPIRTYMPFNVSRTAPEGAIKVLSYNVWTFNNWNSPDEPCEIANYLLAQDADIVCLQEAGKGEYYKQAFDNMMAAKYQYKDSSSTGQCHDEIDVYSKYPILSKERIYYESSSNHSAAFYLNIHGDTVILIANHLQSIGLSDEEKTRFKTMVTGRMETDSAKAESRLLVSKLGNASAQRAPQAQAVADYVSRHADKSIILCGDFNDSPISYTRRTIARNLTDCYAESGNGPGVSYHNSGIYVRIDYIMCSDDWTPYACKVDASIKESDHYPIVCWLEKRENSDK